MHSEDYVEAAVRTRSVAAGFMLFRNNVGVAREVDELTGKLRPVRYGLANDSPAVNKKFKSGDLIGWRRITITPDMVGQTIALFVSREVKAEGWHYSGTEREVAQLAWARLVNEAGGDACFVASPDGFVNPNYGLRYAR